MKPNLPLVRPWENGVVLAGTTTPSYKLQFPLESLANLFQLTKHESRDAVKVCRYMEMAEAEYSRLGAHCKSLSE
jgi:replication-associated recombination protein RarA